MAELCSGISDEDLVGDNGVNLILNAVYKRDALSVVSEAYSSFNDLCKTQRGANESMKSF